MAPSFIAFGVAVLVAAVVVARVLLDGVPPYGTDGAQYIEHIARLTALELWQSREGGNVWAALVAADGSFPATLHFLTLPFGSLFGHSAEVTALTGLVWLGLLAFSVGSVARRLSGRPEIGWVAVAACLLVPAFHGMATRYYYDLPMLAMLWLGVALALRSLAPRCGLLGLASGVCFLLACLIKLSAIPYSVFLVLGVLLLAPEGSKPSLRRRAALGLVIALSVTLGLGLYFSGVEGISSFGHQAHITVPSAQLQTGQSAPPASGVALLLSEIVPRLVAHDLASLAYYPARLVASVLSLPMAALFGVLWWRWWRGRRRGAIGFAAMVLGWMVFHLAVVPPLDDRFLIAVVPVFVVAAALGFGELRASRARFLAGVFVVVGLWTAVDVHFVYDSPLATPVVLLSAQEGPGGRSLHTVLRGLSSAGSFERRGWGRRDEMSPKGQRADRRALREALWTAVRGEQAAVVGGVIEAGAIDTRGDRDWWEYRSQIGGTQSGGATSFTGTPAFAPRPASLEQLDCGDGADVGWDNGAPTHLVLGGLSDWNWLHPCVERSAWQLVAQIEDPDGGPGVTLWSRRVPRGH